jgi:hypothetical protein
MHQVSYTSRRSEVWRWYWREWAVRLWRFHVAFSLLFAAAWTLRDSSVAGFVAAFIVALPIFVLFSALWPQIRFKPATRTLTIDADGWATRIGNLQGSGTWDKVRSIDDSPEAIALVSSNGALIVPNRAFPTSTAREEFLHDARRWQATVAV